ncbi:MAG: hypothetical protein JXR96_27500 [Deltaproteobacteria bacterium]|nr:hypothetical protein [Deltaproteobacteria bacterium]
MPRLRIIYCRSLGTRTERFDCIEFKRRSQAEIMAEYEAREDEFASYADFLNARARDSEWQRALRERLSMAVGMQSSDADT